MDNDIKLFDGQQIRSLWDNQQEKWYFSVIDILGVLTESENPRKYWSVLKTRLKKEGNQLATICSRLKMTASDGKSRMTDVADVQGLFRIIQSVPSPKAEPIKQWLAVVGSERLNETADPELAIDRAVQTYVKKGYSEEWIKQRITSIRIRNELTSEWRDSGVKDSGFAILTDVITKTWSGLTTKEYKNFKGLKKENLRDNMTDLEFVLNMLAEASTTEISKATPHKNFEKNVEVAKRGGSVAREARKKLESEIGKAVISSSNAKKLTNGK